MKILKWVKSVFSKTVVTDIQPFADLKKEVTTEVLVQAPAKAPKKKVAKPKTKGKK